MHVIKLETTTTTTIYDFSFQAQAMKAMAKCAEQMGPDVPQDIVLGVADAAFSVLLLGSEGVSSINVPLFVQVLSCFNALNCLVSYSFETGHLDVLAS